MIHVEELELEAMEMIFRNRLSDNLSHSACFCSTLPAARRCYTALKDRKPRKLSQPYAATIFGILSFVFM